MLKLALVAALSWFAPGLIYAQLPFPTYLNPQSLFVGSGPTSLSIFNQDYNETLTALWNGSPRPTTGSASRGFSIALTAADLAAPQLAQITMVNSAGAIVDQTYCAVGFNVQPAGLAFDATRNQLYIATPAKTGDSRFPPNSVVALNVNTGTVTQVLQIGVALGDVALSDDASALYVVVGGSVVRRINPATFTAAGDLSAPSVSTIRVMPGSPGTVIIQYAPQPTIPEQIAIFDNGVKRANALSEPCCVDFMASPDGKYLVAGGSISFYIGPSGFASASAVLRYSIDSTGIPSQTPLYAAGTAAAAFGGNTLYTTAATAINYQTMQGTGNFGIGGPIAIDTANQRALILYGAPPSDESYGPVELVAFELPGLVPFGTQTVGVSAISSLNAPEQMMRFGTDGVIIPSTNGLLVFHTPLAGPAPAAAAAGVVNAASQTAGPIAPGEIVSIYGTNLGPAAPQGASPNGYAYAAALDGVQVWFGVLPGIPLAAYQGQINVVAPFELQPGTSTEMQVWYFGNPSPQISLPVATAAPALFTQNGSGKGPVAVINQDGSVDTPSPAGSIVTLYGTGGGALPGAVDGALALGARSLSQTVQVSIGGMNAPVLYAGAAPDLVNGVFQINIQVPGNMPSGTASVTLTIGGQTSPQGATLAIR